MLKQTLIVIAILALAPASASADTDCNSGMPGWMAAAFCDHGDGNGGVDSDTGTTDTGGTDTGGGGTDGGQR